MAKTDLSTEDYNRLSQLIAQLPEMLNTDRRDSFLYLQKELRFLRTKLDFQSDAGNFSQQLVRTVERRGTLAETQKPALMSLLLLLSRHDEIQGNGDDLSFINRLLENDASGGDHRILFLASNPVDTNPLRLDWEARAIQDRIRAVPGYNKIQIQQMHAARYTDLVDGMLSFKPSIVHFAGHGGEDGQIIFQNEAGYSEGASPAQVSHLFKTLRQESNALRAVVLNACYLDVLAQVLVEEAGVPYALGMYYAVPDDVAIAFATGFYRGIAASARIDTAFELGRNSLMGDYDSYKDYPSMRQSSQ